MYRTGYIGWLLQRVTAVILIFFLGAHMWYAHYYLEWPLTWDSIINSTFLRVVDIGMLSVGVYHVLYGIRTALQNFGVGAKADKVIAPLFWVLGILVIVFAIQIFFRFL